MENTTTPEQLRVVTGLRYLCGHESAHLFNEDHAQDIRGSDYGYYLTLYQPSVAAKRDTTLQEAMEFSASTTICDSCLRSALLRNPVSMHTLISRAERGVLTSHRVRACLPHERLVDHDWLWNLFNTLLREDKDFCRYYKGNGLYPSIVARTWMNYHAPEDAEDLLLSEDLGVSAEATLYIMARGQLPSLLKNMNRMWVFLHSDYDRKDLIKGGIRWLARMLEHPEDAVPYVAANRVGDARTEFAKLLLDKGREGTIERLFIRYGGSLTWFREYGKED